MNSLYAEPDTFHNLIDSGFRNIVDASPYMGLEYRPVGQGPVNSTTLALPEPFRLVGFHGVAQSGKDTAYSFLKEHHFKRLAFADALRDALYTLNPHVGPAKMPGTGIEFSGLTLVGLVDRVGWERAKKVPEVRRLLQVFGTEVGREMFGEDVWVKKVTDQITRPGSYAVTDVRYLDELTTLSQMGGTLIKIVRPGVVSVNGHKSDAGLADYHFDHVIVNDGTLEEYKAKVLAAVGI